MKPKHHNTRSHLTEDDLADYRREAAEECARLRRGVCECGGDMPGRCPGPENCPMAFGNELENQ